jgi:hypothetical protein
MLCLVITRGSDHRGPEAVQTRNLHDAVRRPTPKHRVSHWLLSERWSVEACGGVLHRRRPTELPAQGAFLMNLKVQRYIHKTP